MGTSLLMDIQPGSSYGYANSGYPSNFTAPGNGQAVFNANDGVHGGELWVTDGTAGGTSMLRDIYPGAFGGANNAASAIGGGKALLGANEPGAGFNELWVTDGTLAGTSMVFNFGNSGDFPAYTTPVGNGLVVFQAAPRRRARSCG